MGFKEGNDYWKDGLKARKEQQDKMDAVMGTIANGGMDTYAEIMDRLASGKELERWEVQFLDRVDSWREWVKPKRAREDGKGESDVPKATQIIVKDTETAKNLQELL